MEKIKNLFSFDSIFKALLIILPFHVLGSVFLQYKLGIPGAGLYKELLIFILLGLFSFEYYKLKKLPKFDKLDYLIFGYFGYLILISIFNFDGLKSIIYGARYDFEFFIIFFLTRHSSSLLKEKLSYYLRIFLISSTIAIGIGILVRFVFGESILVHFGFSPHLSSWNFADGVPIYHGVEGANVRRFQGIFDGPNQTAYFLIVYIGLLFHYLKNKKNSEFSLYSAIVIVGGLIFMTYCRSALLGIVGSLFLVFIFNAKIIFKKYKTQLISILIVVFLLGGAFYMRYGGSLGEIVGRASSTKGHSERMIIGVKQFIKKPLGSGLSSSGPAYRLTHNTMNIDEKNFIPESWFIQQLVEGGIIGFILFGLVLLLIAIQIFSLSNALFFSFMAVLAMNVFLHTFEASYISMILFMFLGLFLKKKEKK